MSAFFSSRLVKILSGIIKCRITSSSSPLFGWQTTFLLEEVQREKQTELQLQWRLNFYTNYLKGDFLTIHFPECFSFKYVSGSPFFVLFNSQNVSFPVSAIIKISPLEPPFFSLPVDFPFSLFSDFCFHVPDPRKKSQCGRWDRTLFQIYNGDFESVIESYCHGAGSLKSNNST